MSAKSAVLASVCVVGIASPIPCEVDEVEGSIELELNAGILPMKPDEGGPQKRFGQS